MSSVTSRLSAALETSIVATTLRETRDESALIDQLARMIEPIWTQASTIPERIHRFRTEGFQTSETRIATAWQSSRVVALVNIMMEWSRGSFFYRWLTREPDPDVVVIDLRDTVIVSPFLTIFEKTVQTIYSSVASSTPERNE